MAWTAEEEAQAVGQLDAMYGLGGSSDVDVPLLQPVLPRGPLPPPPPPPPEPITHPSQLDWSNMTQLQMRFLGDVYELLHRTQRELMEARRLVNTTGKLLGVCSMRVDAAMQDLPR